MVGDRFEIDIQAGVESDIWLPEAQTSDEILVKVAAHVQCYVPQVEFA